MYSFQPLADLTMVHTGWHLSLAIYIIVVLFLIRDAIISSLDKEHLVFFGIISFVLFIVYVASYNDSKPQNIQVTGKFVGFQPEAERVQSGKHTVEHHLMYVVYEVDGKNVILGAQSGVTYPKIATLYKN